MFINSICMLQPVATYFLLRNRTPFRLVTSPVPVLWSTSPLSPKRPSLKAYGESLRLQDRNPLRSQLLASNQFDNAILVAYVRYFLYFQAQHNEKMLRAEVKGLQVRIEKALEQSAKFPHKNISSAMTLINDVCITELSTYLKLTISFEYKHSTYC